MSGDTLREVLDRLGKPCPCGRAFYEDMTKDGILLETKVQNNRVWEHWRNNRLSLDAWFSNWDMLSNKKH